MSLRVMVLGATGYLGSNIVSRLLQDEDMQLTVSVRDRAKAQRIFSSEQLEKLNIISSDLPLIEYILRENEFDCIINTVCTYKPDEKSLYADMLESNLTFPLSVLNLGIKHNAKRFLTIGTALSSDINVYSFSKNQFAEFGRYLSNRGKIDFFDLKLEMFFGGAHESTERFIKSCLVKLQKHEPLLLTKGTQIRDIIRVEDVVEVIYRLLYETRLTGYQQLHLGYGEKHSIRETVEYMKDRLKSDSELCFGAIPMRKGEKDSVADIKWLKDLGYNLRYSWSSGLDKEMEEAR